MNKDSLWICIILGFFLLFLFLSYKENRNRKEKFLKGLRESYGTLPGKVYTEEQLQEIAAYFQDTGKNGFFIDSITWEDLDLKRMFQNLNHTASSPGEEYLYRMLRTPLFEEPVLEERERLITYFEEHTKEREKLQEILSRIRKNGKTSFWSTLQIKKEYDAGKTWKQILMFVGFFLSLGFFMIDPAPGVFIFLLVCTVNILTYVRDKGVIEDYLTGFQSVYRLLDAAKRFRKQNPEGLEAYTARLKNCEEEFAGFQSFSGLVLNREGFSGGMGSLLLDYIRMMTHVDLIKFNSMRKEMLLHRKEIEEMVEIFGLLDACISIASYRKTLPYYTVPEWIAYEKKQPVFMEADELFHPLIRKPVPNSIHGSGGVLVTGSNASGKSTFLKAVALNAILAQTIHTCGAKKYRAPFFKILTSMALRDDLEKDESYFIVEIRSLKRILDETKEEIPVLCIIDEVLRGTNTIERIAASSRILSHLVKPHVLPFAATHDIELSYILEGRYKNYHFEEEVKEKDVKFNYLLKKGRTSTRNAIRLLAMAGYDREIVEESEDAVAGFEAEGIWKKVHAPL